MKGAGGGEPGNEATCVSVVIAAKLLLCVLDQVLSTTVVCVLSRTYELSNKQRNVRLHVIIVCVTVKFLARLVPYMEHGQYYVVST